jgi:hypothetical protein
MTGGSGISVGTDSLAGLEEVAAGFLIIWFGGWFG